MRLHSLPLINESVVGLEAYANSTETNIGFEVINPFVLGFVIVAFLL